MQETRANREPWVDSSAGLLRELPCVGLFTPGDAAVTPLNAQCLEMTMVCFSKVSVSPLLPVAFSRRNLLLPGIY